METFGESKKTDAGADWQKRQNVKAAGGGKGGKAGTARVGKTKFVTGQTVRVQPEGTVQIGNDGKVQKPMSVTQESRLGKMDERVHKPAADRPMPLPFSKEINTAFRGGSPPKFLASRYRKYEKLVRTEPQKVRAIIRADIQFMKAHKYSNNRAINYNLYRSYCLSISELKTLFSVDSLGDLVAKCMESTPKDSLFGT